MTYTGHVVVGGPAQTRELAQLIITKVAVGEYNNNCYLLRCVSTGEQLLIDAAAEPDRLVSLAGDSGLATVFTTHAHRDHWTALADVVAATGAAHEASAVDGELIDVPVDIAIADGDTVRVGEVELTAIHIVGHTEGSLALLYDDPEGQPHLFTGDCLFPGGVGNTRGDAAKFESLLGDVETKLFGRLPDETWVYPGHGDDTTLGAERPHLAEWRERGW